jgi:hypothetical protein
MLLYVVPADADLAISLFWPRLITHAERRNRARVLFTAFPCSYLMNHKSTLNFIPLIGTVDVAETAQDMAVVRSVLDNNRFASYPHDAVMATLEIKANFWHHPGGLAGSQTTERLRPQNSKIRVGLLLPLAIGK